MGRLLFQANLGGLLIAKLGHLDVLDAQAVGPMRGPFDSDAIVEIGPRGMVVLDFALVSD